MLSEFYRLGDFFKKLSASAELGYKVILVFVFEDFDELEYVGVVLGNELLVFLKC